MRVDCFIVIAGLVVAVVACGGGGGSDSVSSAPAVNSQPSSVIVVGETTGHAPMTVQFSGSSSSDSDGRIASYSWDFGDGSNAATSEATHTFTDLGIFSVTLTVTDDDGATATSSVSVKVHAQVAGYYIGSFWSDVTFQRTDVELIVGTNGEMHAWDYVDYVAAYWGNYDISESISSGTLSAQILDPAFTFVDGTQFGAVAFSADVTPRQSIIGTYSGVGDVGPIEVTYLPEISNQPLTLTELAGVWTFSDGFGLSTSLDVSDDGTFAYSSSDGCSADGQLSELDPSINIYAFDYNMNCPPGVTENPNGVRTGLAFVDNYWYADTWLILSGSIGNGKSHIAFSRPKPVSTAQGTSSQKTSATKSMRQTWSRP